MRTLEIASAIGGYTSPVELSLLYHLALLVDDPGDVVEIGSYLGRSTVVLAHAVAERRNGRVVAVDPHTGALGHGEPRPTDQDFIRNVEGAGVEHQVDMWKMTSRDAASRWTGQPVRMLFVDGCHSYEAVMHDFAGWARFLTPNASVVFDDYPDPGIHAAVRDLRTRGMLAGVPLIVGKMMAFVPKRLLPALPCPPGASLLGRLGNVGFYVAYRLKPPSPIYLPPP